MKQKTEGRHRSDVPPVLVAETVNAYFRVEQVRMPWGQEGGGESIWKFASI